MKADFVLLTLFTINPILGQYCPKECENQGILCNIKCVFSNIQNEFANNNNSSNEGNRGINPTPTNSAIATSNIKATFRSLRSEGQEIASEVKATAKSISKNPGGFASSLITNINDELKPTQTSFDIPSDLNNMLTTVKNGGNELFSTLESGFQNGFTTATETGDFSSDLSATASIIRSDGRNLASTLSSGFANGFTTPSGALASSKNSIGVANILGISLVTLSAIILSSLI